MGCFTATTILRWLSWLPWGYFGITSLSLYNAIKDHDILRHPPYPKNLFPGQGITAIVGMFGMAWCFASFALEGHFWVNSFGQSGSSPTFTMISLLFDLAIAASLFTALILQSTYLPHTLAGCSGADKWMVPVGSNQTSLFSQIAIIHNATTAAANMKLKSTETCKQYVSMWIMGFVMMFLAFIAVLISLSLGVSTPIRQWKDAISRYPPIRYSWRYLSKRRQTIHGSSSFRLRSLRGKALKQTNDIGLAKLLGSDDQVDGSTEPHETNKSGYAPPLESQDAKYDVLELIAYKLHYVDIVNLSMVSRRIHKAIFSNPKFGEQSDLLRRITCVGDTKSQCWACNIQICTSCEISRNCKDTDASVHLQRCRAHCSKCYYKVLRNARDPYFRKPKACQCAGAVPPVSTTYYMNGTWSAPIFPSSFDHPVCRSCNVLPIESMLRLREKRDKDEINQLVRQPLNCSDCRVALPNSGPRWWVCSKCNIECRNAVHPPWAPKAEV